MNPYPLAWTRDIAQYGPNHQEAVLTNPDATIGVRFSIDYMPTCYRRGPYKLLIEITDDAYHFAWGCFDLADQPMRYYHSERHAMAEAQLIANVLLLDFKPERVAKTTPP